MDEMSAESSGQVFTKNLSIAMGCHKGAISQTLCARPAHPLYTVTEFENSSGR